MGILIVHALREPAVTLLVWAPLHVVYSLHNNNYQGHCDSTSQVQSVRELVTYPDTKLNGVSGDNMFVAGHR